MTGPPVAVRTSQRIATIDWMRGVVMILMIIDHASMAFDGSHLSEDSALYPGAATMALPAAEFFTRWITHLCAPTFVFLAGSSLALSVERRVLKGLDAWVIDKNILTRGAIIALMDPTLISLGSGWWTFSVLTAIGLSMMCMAGLRRLPSWARTFWLNAELTEAQAAKVPVKVAAGRMMPRAPADTFMAAGAHDNRLYVIPSRDLVIVRLGDGHRRWSDDAFLAALLGP